MPNIGAPEILIILLVALVVFGPRKLPELGKSIGAGIREFRKSTSAVTDELRRGLDTPAAAPAAESVVAPDPALAAVPAVTVASAVVPAVQVVPENTPRP